MKTCSHCHIEKPFIDFHNSKRTISGLSAWCRTCHKVGQQKVRDKNPEKFRAYRKKYYKENKDKLNEQQKIIARKRRKEHPEIDRGYGRTRRAKRKAMVLEAYGNKCNCCPETIPQFLTIDHIDGKGRKHIEEIGGSSKLYDWLIRNNYPKDNFQLLCMNCNFAKGHYGACPHQATFQEVHQAQDSWLSGIDLPR
jgi:hypothetical protein